MTLTLVRKLLRDARLSLLVVCVLLVGFSAMWVKIAQRVSAEIAPFFNGLAAAQKFNPQLFDEVLFRGPGKVSQAVMGGAGIRFERPTDFLAVMLLHPVVLVLGCVWAVNRSAGAVAGELDRGTMELLLSQPVPRWKLVLAHFLVDLICLPLLGVSLVAGTRLGLWLVGPFTIDYSVLDKIPSPIPLPRGPAVLEVNADGQPAAALVYVALLFAVSGLTAAVSAATRSRATAVGGGMLLVVGMFVVNLVGQLWEPAAVLRPLSLFFYYHPQEVWLKGNPWVDMREALPGVPLAAFGPGVLLAVGLAGYAVAYRVFVRRDLPAPL
jgi:ABC-2 type transport system permease protein